MRKESMQTVLPTRTIHVSMDTFAAIWADRRPGENSEDAIIRRRFDVQAMPTEVQQQETPALTDRRPSPSGPGYHDRRFGARFAEGFEIFRHYKGTDYSAKATSGAWLLMNNRDLYPSLNGVSQG